MRNGFVPQHSVVLSAVDIERKSFLIAYPKCINERSRASPGAAAFVGRSLSISIWKAADRFREMKTSAWTSGIAASTALRCGRGLLEEKAWDLCEVHPVAF